MCLVCKNGQITKKELKNIFFPRINGKLCYMTSVYLHTFDNKSIHLNNKQLREIANNALCVEMTGVDSTVDIWAIQWPNDYKVLTLK